MSKSWTRKSSAIVVASLFGATLAGPAFAQATAPKQQPTATMKEQTAAARNMRASQLIGKDVRNAQGEDLGDIKDVILDLANGRVHYVVLSFGGFLGLGDKLFAYPIRSFKPAADKDELVLTVDKEKLKNAPGFDANRYPDWNTAEYRSQVDRYFGSTAATKGKPRFVRASELIGKDVNDPNGRDLGEIHDVVINMSNGDVRYAVLEFDQSWSLKDKLFAFPLRSFRSGPQWKDDLVLGVSKDALNNTPGFDKNSWPNVNDPKWVADVDRYLVATTVTPLPSTTNDAMFRRIDSNNDGVLSADEARKDTSVNAAWKKMDADNNGRVTRTEFDSAYRK